jgi:hypothetical protein
MQQSVFIAAALHQPGRPRDQATAAGFPLNAKPYACTENSIPHGRKESTVKFAV